MQIQHIQDQIREIRDMKVMLDYDLAALYETETKKLKQAVRRNIDRFPSDFMFELTKEESDFLRSQNVTLENQGKGHHSKYLPFAFTEQGVAMLSTVLNSTKAISVNIAIMRTFVFMRQFALTHKDLTEQLKVLETKFSKQFKDVYEAINYLLDKEKQVKNIESKKIGFVQTTNPIKKK